MLRLRIAVPADILKDMQNVAFDTHAFVKLLTGAGMPEPQAEVLAEEQSCLIRKRLTAKPDPKEPDIVSKCDLKELETVLRRDIRESERKIVIRLGAIVVIGIGVGVLAAFDNIL